MIEREVIDKWGKEAADRIASACNDESSAAEHPGTYMGLPTNDEEKRGYRAGTEGEPSKTLKQGSYRATVITTTMAAMADNARHNRLLENLHHAEGDE
jgi:hypothetical protein